jgi:hypothetical protein
MWWITLVDMPFSFKKCFKGEWASYWDHLNGALRQYGCYVRNGFVRFNFFRSQVTSELMGLNELRCELRLSVTSELTGLNELRWELGLLSIKRTIGSYFWDFSATS